MTWERVRTEAIRGSGVTVSWRTQGGRKNPALAVSIGKVVCEKLGLEKGTTRLKSRVVVERNRVAGKLRLRLAPEELRADAVRHVAWKDKGCTIAVPMDDVKLSEKKPAQDVVWTLEDGWLVVKLPHWACPIVKISGAA